MNFFKILYALILVVGYLILLPFLLIFSFKQKYHKSIPARFFLLQSKPKDDTEIWIHACSFGEVKSLEPVIADFLKQDKKILLTTTTQTGFELAQKTFGHLITFQVLFLPFELFISSWKKRLKNLQAFIVTESELWYMPFFMAKSLGARTFLINARISDRSYDRYLKLQFYYKEIFKYVDKIFAQSHNDLLRLQSLGAEDIKVYGNLKIYSEIKTTKLYAKPSKIVIVAGSTHPEEENIVLNVFNRFQKQYPQSLLVLAPRHPERFEEVAHMLEGYKVGNLSRDGIDEEADIILVDVLGELNNLYRIADVVILCGSFVKVGGHNPLEPAYFNTRLLCGPYIFNQYALFDCIEGYSIVQNSEELEKKLLDFENLPLSKINATKNDFDNFMREFAI